MVEFTTGLFRTFVVPTSHSGSGRPQIAGRDALEEPCSPVFDRAMGSWSGFRDGADLEVGQARS